MKKKKKKEIRSIFFFFLAIFGRTFEFLRRTLFNIFDTNGVSLVSQTYVLEHTLWNIFLILMACHTSELSLQSNH